MNNANKEQYRDVLKDVSVSDLNRIVNDDFMRFVIELQPDKPAVVIDTLITELVQVQENAVIAERYDLAKACKDNLEWLIDEMPFKGLMKELV